MVRKFFIPLIIILVLDVITKFFIALYQPSIKLLPFLSIVFVKNTGAGFGILKGQNLLLIIISVLVLGFIWYYFRDIPKTQQLAMGLVTGGIIGNLIDRLFRGFVVDFVDFFIASHHWPAFNIADAAIVIGVLILIIRKD